MMEKDSFRLRYRHDNALALYRRFKVSLENAEKLGYPMGESGSHLSGVYAVLRIDMLCRLVLGHGSV